MKLKLSWSVDGLLSTGPTPLIFYPSPAWVSLTTLIPHLPSSHLLFLLPLAPPCTPCPFLILALCRFTLPSPYAPPSLLPGGLSVLPCPSSLCLLPWALYCREEEAIVFHDHYTHRSFRAYRTCTHIKEETKSMKNDVTVQCNMTRQ